MRDNSQEIIETSTNNNFTPESKQAWETPTLDTISMEETESGASSNFAENTVYQTHS